jgi:hypothetical protein
MAAAVWMSGFPRRRQRNGGFSQKHINQMHQPDVQRRGGGGMPWSSDFTTALESTHVPPEHVYLLVVRVAACCSTAAVVDARVTPAAAARIAVDACRTTHRSAPGCGGPGRSLAGADFSRWSIRTHVGCPAQASSPTANLPLAYVHGQTFRDALAGTLWHEDAARAWRMLVSHKTSATLHYARQHAGLSAAAAEALARGRPLSDVMATPFALLAAERAAGWTILYAVPPPDDVHVPEPDLPNLALLRLGPAGPSGVLARAAERLLENDDRDVGESADVCPAPGDVRVDDLLPEFYAAPARFVLARIQQPAVRSLVVWAREALSISPGDRVLGTVLNTAAAAAQSRAVVAALCARYAPTPRNLDTYQRTGCISLLICALFGLGKAASVVKTHDPQPMRRVNTWEMYAFHPAPTAAV